MAHQSLSTVRVLQSRPSANLMVHSRVLFKTTHYRKTNHHINRVFARADCRAALSEDVAFQRLGLPQGASERDIKKAYRKLALQFHPDVCKDDSCTSNFLQINDAYQVIMNCLQGKVEALAREPFVGESMMGVYDEDWEDWEEWMGWEGAGAVDYSTHINHAL